MGGRNMHFVASCLDGADVSLEGWDRKQKCVVPGCERVRDLEASDLAMLLMLAYRQRDANPEEGYPDEECLSYGGEGHLRKLMRLLPAKFEESRAFLLANGFISYSRHEENCLDVRNPRKRRAYDYVYRLNKGALARLKHTDSDETLLSRVRDPAQQGQRI